MRSSTKLLRSLAHAAGAAAGMPALDAATARVLPAALARFASASASMAQAKKQEPDTAMFCFQCEQTAHGTGCTTVGQCGKTPETAGLQDLLIFSLKGLGSLAHHARAAGVTDPEVDSFILHGMFSTITNVNFDSERFRGFLDHCQKLHARLAAKLQAKGVAMPTIPEVSWFAPLPHPAAWNLGAGAALSPATASMEQLSSTARLTGVALRQEALGATVAGLQELIMYGLKGLCAYAAHAEALGRTDPTVAAGVEEALWLLSSPKGADPNALLAGAMQVGSVNMTVMKMLSEAHTDKFGHPTPTEVSTIPREGKCILITGHDMADLEALLKATEGTGVNVYTHGEMLPAHGYPGLKKYPHLAGNYGGAWYKQKMDFAYFPGAIVVTTNCVLDPMPSYRNNMFTMNATGVAGVKHLDGRDFGPVIARAKELRGFSAKDVAMASRTATSSGGGGRGSVDAGPGGKAKTVTVGFGHNVVLSVADQVLDAVKGGKLSHIFLVGGCDGHEPQRAYYSRLAQVLPKETMLLTLGCGKYRLIDQDFGTLPGTHLPRLLDMGQCNDAYSALVVATELAKALKTDVNSLPLSLDISWFEQKAVAVLLTLLSLGVKNIRLGPALPAFVTPEALQVLVDKFQIKPANTAYPELDLQAMMKNQ